MAALNLILVSENLTWISKRVLIIVVEILGVLTLLHSPLWTLTCGVCFSKLKFVNFLWYLPEHFVGCFIHHRLVSCGDNNIRFWRIRHGSLRSCPVDLGRHGSVCFTDIVYGAKNPYSADPAVRKVWVSYHLQFFGRLFKAGLVCGSSLGIKAQETLTQVFKTKMRS